MCYKNLIIFIKYEKIVVLLILNVWSHSSLYVRLVIKENFAILYSLFPNNKDMNLIT